MTFDQGVSLLREFGFPVFVATWFMWRLEKRLDRGNELTAKLIGGVDLLAKSIDYHFIDAKPEADQPPEDG